eukprot:Clim_evm83s157 gene=Clim_evmTU83s157
MSHLGPDPAREETVRRNKTHTEVFDSPASKTFTPADPVETPRTGGHFFEDNQFMALEEQFGKLVCIMVGLPARGKTFMARKVCRYLNWLSIPSKVFNVGDIRRQKYGPVTHEYFDPNKEEGRKKREEVMNAVCHEICQYLEKDSGMVAFYDAANVSRSERAQIHEHLSSCLGHVQVLYIESVCTDTSIIQMNLDEVKLSSPEYADRDNAAAKADFNQRIAYLERNYEPLDFEHDTDKSWIKIHEAGERFVMSKIQGYIQCRAAYYLMNVRLRPKTIYLSRHGESEYNVLGRIGGDAGLSSRGEKYAEALRDWINKNAPKDLKVWTSTLRRARATAAKQAYPVAIWPALDEINAGACDGMTYEEIAEKFPVEFALRDADKFGYRYPRGESYRDLVHRLEPVIMELERSNNVLVVGHQAVLRCITSYFLDRTSAELPYEKVPLHTIIKLNPVAYGVKIEKFKQNIDAVDTHRERPSNVNPNRTIDEALATVPSHE